MSHISAQQTVPLSSIISNHITPEQAHYLPMPVLTVTNLTLLYGEIEIFANLDLQIDERDRIGIVGPNGAGKTSLIRILTGELEANGGAVTWQRGARIGYVPQTPSQAPDGTVNDEVMQAFARLRQVEDELASSALDIQRAQPHESTQQRGAALLTSLLHDFEALGGYDYYIPHGARGRRASDYPRRRCATPSHLTASGGRADARRARPCAADRAGPARAGRADQLPRLPRSRLARRFSLWIHGRLHGRIP